MDGYITLEPDEDDEVIEKGFYSLFIIHSLEKYLINEILAGSNGDLVLLRPPPVNKQKSNIELVSKHLQQLSCVLLNTRDATSSHFSKMSAGLSIPQQQQQQHQQQEETPSTGNTEMISKQSESLSSSTTITSGESTNSTTITAMTESQKQHHYKPVSTLQHLWLSQNHPSLSRAITRAQGLLNSDIACEALERASLQLVISTSSSSSQIKLTKDNLPLLDTAENLGYTLLYLDANSGECYVL
ncbi:unnamed protein product [Trichobilharzia regenti]|nr:unnamed protein product [Trichobilharzia regenti]